MESEAERSSGSTVSPGPYVGSGITACSPASPYFLDSALPSDSDHNYDHHSSEEELEVINNPSNCAAVGTSAKELLTCRSGSVSTVMPEKRKWSQMTAGSTCSLSNTCHQPTHSSGRLTIAETCSFIHGGSSCNVELGGGGGGSRASVAVIATTPAADQSSGSSDEEVQGLLAAMATPVQFRTSPPLDAHKPGRSQSPPPKLFHYGGNASAAAALEVSPRKRHRHTPRAHHIQRPCLDFEKMQQVSNRSAALAILCKIIVFSDLCLWCAPRGTRCILPRHKLQEESTLRGETYFTVQDQSCLFLKESATSYPPSTYFSYRRFIDDCLPFIMRDFKFSLRGRLL